MAGILAVAETRRGELREVSFELIGAGVSLKSAAGGSLSVAVIDAEPERSRIGLAAPAWIRW